MTMRRWSLKAKLATAFAAQVLFMAILGITGYVSLERVSVMSDRVSGEIFSKEKLLSEFRLLQKDLNIAARTAMIAGATEADMAEQSKAVADADAKFDLASKKFEALPKSDDQSMAWQKVKENWRPQIEIANRIISLSKLPEKKEELNTLFKKDFSNARNAVRIPLEKLRDIQSVDSDLTNEVTSKTSRFAKLTMQLVTALGLLSSIWVAYYLTTHLKRSLVEIAAALSKGAVEVAGAASSMLSLARDLDSSASQQASALHETSAAIVEISSMVKKTSENAQSTHKIATVSLESVNAGQQMIRDMVQSLTDIRVSNGEIGGEVKRNSEEMQQLVHVIGDIGKKTQVINDIVFQTKLLSFNASVEAARAGEHGKGFAVVAEEVGKLAQMSGNAAREINDMLTASVRQVETLVNESKQRLSGLIQAGEEKTSRGVELIQQCDDAFTKIVNETGQLGSLIDEIFSATAEQAEGVEEVTKAIGLLDRASHQNQKLSKDSATSANMLDSEAQALEANVSTLNVAIDGEVVSTSSRRQNFQPVEAADRAVNSATKFKDAA